MMKRIVALITVAILASSMFGSCTKEEKEVAAPSESVTPPAEISITVAPTTLTLYEGQTSTLTATVCPSDASNKTVNWSSTSTSVATVDKNGKVTAKKEGVTTIIATCGAKSGTCSVTVKKKVVPKGAVDLDIVMTRDDGTTYILYWAQSNLCETGLCANPEDYGDYYAWGETEPYYTKGHSQDNPCSDLEIPTESDPPCPLRK